MVQRWIVSDNGKLKEYPSGVAICKKYNCSGVSLYARLKCNNKNYKSPIFGRNIRVFRLEGEFGDEIDDDKLEIYNCDMCDKPVTGKNIHCDECNEKIDKIYEEKKASEEAN